MLSAEARTVRGGETRMIAADQLVPGDVVLLESGDKVPADLRLADVNNFRTEETALTGESVPADKTTDVVSANATVLPGYRLTPTRPKGTLVAQSPKTCKEAVSHGWAFQYRPEARHRAGFHRLHRLRRDQFRRG